MISIILYGRGGQGVNFATRILGNAAFLSKMYVQDFILAPMERRGFPVIGQVKVDTTPIQSNYLEPADFALVFDKKLPISFDLKEKSVIIFNSKDKIKTKKDVKSFLVDADTISIEILKKHHPNIVMLGALLKVFDKIPLRQMRTALENNKEHLVAIDEGMKNLKRN